MTYHGTAMGAYYSFALGWRGSPVLAPLIIVILGAPNHLYVKYIKY